MSNHILQPVINQKLQTQSLTATQARNTALATRKHLAEKYIKLCIDTINEEVQRTVGTTGEMQVHVQCPPVINTVEEHMAQVEQAVYDYYKKGLFDIKTTVITLPNEDMYSLLCELMWENK